MGEGQNTPYGLISFWNDQTQGQYRDQLWNMLQGQNNSGLAGLSKLLGGGGNQPLNAFRLGPNDTPSWWNNMLGYSQNGQNYQGWGGAALNAGIGGLQAYMNYQAYKAQRDLARDQFNLQKDQFEDSKKRYWDKWDRNNAARESAMR